MAFYYPHRQTVIIFVVSVLAVAGTIWYVKGPAPVTSNVSSTAAVSAVAPTNDLAAVSASGDWRKQFYDSSKTGSFKTSTQKTSADSSGDAPLTATDALARDFMARYMQMHKAGLDTDQKTIDSVASQLITNGVANVVPPRSFALSDIKTTSAVDKATLSAYGRSISAILHSYLPDSDHNEAQIAIQALDNGDMTLLKKIDPVISNYREAAAALMSMRVPAPLAQYHLNLVNGVAMALFNAKALRNLESDPLTGLGAISLEMQGLQTMSDAQDSIASYLQSVGVVFGQS